VEFYDFYEAWAGPNATDKSLYLGKSPPHSWGDGLVLTPTKDKRSGILAQAAPNIGPL
jgi:hypothetical protein